MNLNSFFNNSIADISKTLARFYIKNRKGRVFARQIYADMKKSAEIREEYENKNIHIPPFLIASIASQCNLRCAGCYARANGSCGCEEIKTDLSAPEWAEIFRQASETGISFILLAGGEPLLRRDIIYEASKYKNIVFPVFTNGTVIDEDYINFFDTHRNLVPVLSIEGDENKTDARRGKGVFEILRKTAARFKEKGILFGSSITVTSENKKEVTQSAFVGDLRKSGCGIIFFIEYVPAEKNTEYLVLSDNDLSELQSRINILRLDKKNKGIIILSFPGDEAALGGCLAAGRGFFHINAAGGAEPCPFSPFSVMNLKKQPLIEVLASPFFSKVQQISASQSLNHKGGCTLFEHKDEILNAVKE